MKWPFVNFKVLGQKSTNFSEYFEKPVEIVF